mgnify:CR=1 FL=1
MVLELNLKCGLDKKLIFIKKSSCKNKKMIRIYELIKRKPFLGFLLKL